MLAAFHNQSPLITMLHHRLKRLNLPIKSRVFLTGRLFCVGVALNFSSFGRNCVATFPWPGLSPPQRPLCDVGRLGRKKKRGNGARWEGEREKRGLCHIMCGSLAGFAVLLFWLNQPTIRTLLRADLKKTPFPSSHRPPRALYFFYYCYFYRDTQPEPLRRREWVLYLF